MRSDINLGRSMNLPVSQEASLAWSTYDEVNDRTPIVLLETALWDQLDPYNCMLPLGWVTGCPATAIAIIMRYHQWPEKGVGTIPQYRDEIPAIELGHVYDWSKMPLSYSSSASQAEREQVGVLMRDVGAMIRTEYGNGTAGAKPEETLPQLLPVFMRYNKSTIKSIFKKNHSNDEWFKILNKELDEKRPVLYGGYSSGGGHEFVLDGYAENNYYHVNWGWSGVSNGYYLLVSLNPPEQGTGGSQSSGGFNKKQDAVIGIQPDPNNKGGDFYDMIAYKPFNDDKYYGMTTEATTFEQNVPVKVDLKDFQNKGSRTFAGKLAIGHYDEDGLLKGIVSNEISYDVYHLEINDFTEAYFTCTITEPIEPGDRLCGVYKHLNPSDWAIIRNGYVGNDKCIDEILLEEGDTPNPPAPTDDLGDHVSVRFNKSEQVLTVMTSSEDAVQLQLMDSAGKNLTGDVCGSEGPVFVIDTRTLDGDYILILQSEKRGSVELMLKF